MTSHESSRGSVDAIPYCVGRRLDRCRRPPCLTSVLLHLLAGHRGASGVDQGQDCQAAQGAAGGQLRQGACVHAWHARVCFASCLPRTSPALHRWRSLARWTHAGRRRRRPGGGLRCAQGRRHESGARGLPLGGQVHPAHHPHWYVPLQFRGSNGSKGKGEAGDGVGKGKMGQRGTGKEEARMR